MIALSKPEYSRVQANSGGASAAHGNEALFKVNGQVYNLEGLKKSLSELLNHYEPYSSSSNVAFNGLEAAEVLARLEAANKGDGN